MTEERALRQVMQPAVVYLSILVFVGLLCLIGLVWLYVPLWRMDRAADTYSGDGVLRVTSRSVVTPGYRIDFEAFDLSQPHARTYSIEGLPRIDAPARVGLYFDEISDRVYGIRGGVLAMSVAADGNEVMEVDAPIADWNFSDQIGISVTYFSFETKARSSFDMNALPENARATLSVRYTPPAGVDPSLRGHVRLQVGGYE